MAERDVELAVRAFHDLHAPALHAWARQRTADPRDAEEVVQQTFVQAWRNQDQFDPERGSERAWLFGIARNVAVDQHRRRRRHLRAVPTGEVPDSIGDDEVERAVQASHVVDALALLSDDHRRVVVETYYRGRTAREAAAELGIPEGTVKSRLYHALRALRAELVRNDVLP